MTSLNGCSHNCIQHSYKHKHGYLKRKFHGAVLANRYFLLIDQAQLIQYVRNMF